MIKQQIFQPNNILLHLMAFLHLTAQIFQKSYNILLWNAYHNLINLINRYRYLNLRNQKFIIYMQSHYQSLKEFLLLIQTNAIINRYPFIKNNRVKFHLFILLPIQEQPFIRANAPTILRRRHFHIFHLNPLFFLFFQIQSLASRQRLIFSLFIIRILIIIDIVYIFAVNDIFAI
jgi:hypothetical protein